MRNDLLTLLRQLQSDFWLEQETAETRRPVVGVLCNASPVEIIEALGLIPRRLLSSTPEDELRGGRFLASDSCPFCKSIVGNLDRLEHRVDAILGSTTCDQMRRNLEIIARDLHLPVFIYNAPRSFLNPEARRFAKRELQRISSELSEWSGRAYNDAALSLTIQRRQAAREKIALLIKTQGAEQQLPGLTGGEALEIIHFFQSVDHDYFQTHWLKIEEFVVRRGSPYQQTPLRLALLGSCIGEADRLIVDLIEEDGKAAIIFDNVCTGRQVLKIGAPLPDDSFEALLTLYFDRLLCPHRRPNDVLLAESLRGVHEGRVAGIVYKTLKFCHPWDFEAKRFKEALQLPFIHLDHDLSLSNVGQLRTRIHAFLEQLRWQKKLN